MKEKIHPKISETPNVIKNEILHLNKIDKEINSKLYLKNNNIAKFQGDSNENTEAFSILNNLQKGKKIFE